MTGAIPSGPAPEVGARTGLSSSGHRQKGVGSRFRHEAGSHYISFSRRNRLPTPFTGRHPSPRPVLEQAPGGSAPRGWRFSAPRESESPSVTKYILIVPPPEREKGRGPVRFGENRSWNECRKGFGSRFRRSNAWSFAPTPRQHPLEFMLQHVTGTLQSSLHAPREDILTRSVRSTLQSSLHAPREEFLTRSVRSTI